MKRLLLQVRERSWLAGAAVIVALSLDLFWQRLAAMVRIWSSDGFYSQGWLIPCLALFLAWVRREQLRRIQPRPRVALGLSLIAAAAILVIGTGSLVSSITPALLVTFGSGLILCFCGWESLRTLRMPLLTLLLMIPIPPGLRSAVDFPLQLFCVRTTVFLAHLLGIGSSVDGVTITVAGMTIYVAPACNGLRSAAALFAGAVVYGDILNLSARGRFALAATAIPVAYVANLVRLLSLAVFLRLSSPPFVDRYEHAFDLGWGLVIFSGIALICFLLLHRTKVSRPELSLPR
jgi:exosortase